MDRERITSYVRLGSSTYDRDDEGDSRNISFPRPKRIPAADLLKLGLALDGNQVVFNVGPGLDRLNNLRYFYPDLTGGNEPANSLPEALAGAEKALVAFLDKYGYDVEFA